MFIDKIEKLKEFLAVYGFTEIKFPFGTSRDGKFGAGCVVFNGESLLFVPYNRTIKRKHLVKKYHISNSPGKVARWKTRMETGLKIIPSKEEDKEIIFLAKNDFSGALWHDKYFYFVRRFKGNVLNWKKFGHRHKRSPRIGTPVWVPIILLKKIISDPNQGLIRGNHKDALCKIIEEGLI